MVGPWPYRAFTFRALSKTYGQTWLRCDVCRRYARLKLAGLHDVDYRAKTFSCSRCGAAAHLCLVEPIKETGMDDYRLDEVEAPARHPKAVQRLTDRTPSLVDQSGGELPGRNLKGRSR
jgi:hypothetical protein